MPDRVPTRPRRPDKRSAKLSHFVIHRGLIISIMQAVFSAAFYFVPIALYQVRSARVSGQDMLRVIWIDNMQGARGQRHGRCRFGACGVRAPGLRAF